MLAEFQSVQPESGTNRRRWFQDDLRGLIIWDRFGESPDGFQICYPGADHGEPALTWREGRGFSHARVDQGDDRPDKNLTPILLPDGAVPWARVEREFAPRRAEMEPAIRDFVSHRLRRREG